MIKSVPNDSCTCKYIHQHTHAHRLARDLCAGRVQRHTCKQAWTHTHTHTHTHAYTKTCQSRDRYTNMRDVAVPQSKREIDRERHKTKQAVSQELRGGAREKSQTEEIFLPSSRSRKCLLPPFPHLFFSLPLRGSGFTVSAMGS